MCAVSCATGSAESNCGLHADLLIQICTDILYQPLTLLDCLHSFCGSCLKEWFTWQAAAAARNRRTANPYTCPSCRESVRGTRADWRLTTLLDGFLKANPDKSKSEQEQEEIRQLYKPGEDVLRPVEYEREESDSGDERLMEEVRQLSITDPGSDAARRGAERMARDRRRQEEQRRQQRISPEELARRQQPSRWAAQQARLTESTLREHDRDETRIEHQPSLRSLLSASDADSQDVQAEILRAIYAEGVLDGLDLDNLTTEQEEELTDRIAEAYRRRQRQRSRSRNRERRQREGNSPRAAAAEPEPRQNQEPSNRATTQQQETRSRPPVSRPHLLEQTPQDPARGQRRSPSATSQQSSRSATRNDNSAGAARSATDLSQQPSTDDAHRDRRRPQSNSGRSVTDPQTGVTREQIHHLRADSNNTRNDDSNRRPQHNSASQPPSVAWASTAPRNNSASSVPRSPPATTTEQAVRSAPSHAAFAPELVSGHNQSLSNLTTICNRCEKSIQRQNLHYNCSKCRAGDFNLCLSCYRAGQGCDHWFGFGFRAYDRWYRNAPPEGWPAGFEWPHILTPRRYTAIQESSSTRNADATESTQLQEGAFCESCFSFANDLYWYCNICLEGAWGFCDNCVKQGKHCTHPLLAVAHISILRQPHYDPTKASIVGLPHLRQDSYATLPVTTDCDICHRQIPPNSTRFHCYKCSDGDYDVCNECYRNLVAQGKISEANGPNGWRRCLKGHRMAVIGYQDTSDGGHLRMTVREPIGGWAFKEDDISMSSQIPSGGLPPDGGVGMRCLALYSYFPGEGANDELAFPKNAEIREVENKNGDWFWGVYAGKINLFPSNHVRVL